MYIIALPDCRKSDMYENVITNYEDELTQERRRVLGIPMQLMGMKMSDIPDKSCVAYTYYSWGGDRSMERYIEVWLKHKDRLKIDPSLFPRRIDMNISGMTYESFRYIAPLIRMSKGTVDGMVFKNRLEWIARKKIDPSEVKICGMDATERNMEIWIEHNNESIELIGLAIKNKRLKEVKIKDMLIHKMEKILSDNRGLVLRARVSEGVPMGRIIELIMLEDA